MSEEDVEALYNTPSHLSTSGSIGIIPDRTFYVGLGAILIGALPAYAGLVHFGPKGLAIGGITFLLAIPFSLWFLNPPFEHGLIHLFVHRFSRKTLNQQHLRYLKNVRVVNDIVYLNPEPSTECLAILSLPTLNLDLASVASKRRHRRQFGMLLDGISTHQFQIVVRSETLPNMSALERMRLNRNPFARRLADWLADHHKQQQAIDRRRYLILPADNPEILTERVETISRSLRQTGLDPERLSDPADLRDLINNWWTWRPHPVRLGPETIVRSAKHLQIDGDFVRVFALGKLPTVIQTNWWYRIIDGDLPCDISMTMKQQELSLAKWRLDLKYNALASSNSSPSRQIALEQVRQLRLAFETRVRPWSVQILLVVRGHDLKALDKVSNRLKQQCKDLGGEIRLLRWEQVEGMQSAQPLCGYMLPSRALYLESGTLARTTPLSASTLQMLDGVPWGVSGSTPILLTTKGMRTGRHFGWYGFTGCIAPETVLQTPDGNFKVSEIKQPFRVWALSETGQPVPAWAETPYIKGTADLYRVKLRSGREVCATLQHRVLTPDGWRKLEDVCVGTQIAVAANISQTKVVQSDQNASVQHLKKTLLDLMGHYSGHFHPDVPQLHQVTDSDPTFALQPVGVRVHSQSDCNTGDLGLLQEHNHAYQQRVHLSKNSFCSVQDRDHVVRCLSDSISSLLPSQNIPAESLHQPASFQINTGQLHLVLEDFSDDLDAEYPSRSSGALDSLDYDTIVSISFEHKDIYYDLHVPKYENYLAEEIWHHNSGKGFGVRCYLARRHFADRLRIFMWDADDAQHEYAGRFTEFLQGIRLELKTLKDVEDIQIDPRWQVVAFDVSGMNRDLQPQAFAKVKHLVEEHVLAFPGETAFVVDEATTLAEHPDQTGARALGDAVQTWRKRGIECHIITQRVTDWFGTAIGRKIQGNLAVKWYGAQEDSELYEVARRVNLSTEERDRIGAAGIGEGLLVAFGRRVWSNLYDQCSPELEVPVYSTDPPERVEVLAVKNHVA